LAKARELAPEAPGLKAAANLLASRMAAAQQAARQSRPAVGAAVSPGTIPAGASVKPQESPPVEPAELSAQKKREIADLYRRGIDAREAGAVEEALHYWEIVWSADPGFQRVSEYLKQEYLTRGMEAFVAGELTGAVNIWEKALRVDPADERTNGYLQRAREQIIRMQRIGGDTR
jgi:hypothetical protein